VGYSLSWAAVKGVSLQTICSALSFRLTGRREEIPESDIVAAQLPTGWSVVILNHEILEGQKLESLSEGREVVYCLVEEHVMLSSASGLKDGQTLWTVHHNAQRGELHLEVEGTPPRGLERIREVLVAKQKAASGENTGVDYLFDVPLELARDLTGFRHDADIPGVSGDVFEILEPVK
jgi:hypothetical protein